MSRQIPFPTTPEESKRIPGFRRILESLVSSNELDQFMVLAHIDQGVFELLERLAWEYSWRRGGHEETLKAIRASVWDYEISDDNMEILINDMRVADNNNGN